jgi:glucose-1-phosphate adenylyltransferase
MNFTEKPQYPRTNLASMSVYVFRCEVLVEELKRAVRGNEGEATFQIHEILRRMMPRRRAYGFVHHGSWHYTRTLDEYYAFHRELLGARPRVDLAAWHVRTNVLGRRAEPPPPARCLPGSQVENSLLSPGCVIEGVVRNSVLSPGVHVAKNAEVVDSILWDDVSVEEGARLNKVISDKRTLFRRQCQVGIGEAAHCEEEPESLTCGAVLVGMDARIAQQARIGRNCIIHADVQEADVPAQVASGKSVSSKEVA